MSDALMIFGALLGLYALVLLVTGSGLADAADDIAAWWDQ